MLLFEILDGMPVELKLLGDVLDRGRSASFPDIVREAFRVERIDLPESPAARVSLSRTPCKRPF